MLHLLTALFGFAGAIMLLKNERAKRRIVELQEKLDRVDAEFRQLKEFANGVATTEYVDTDLIILGPRGHGKTSVVTAMTQQWKSITHIRATAVDFVCSHWELPTFTDKKYTDPELKIERIRRKRSRIAIYDYAGEDQSTGVAIERIAGSANCIVIFVLSAEPHPQTNSASYLNVNTLRRMRTALARAQEQSLRAMIIFSKHDLTDFSTTENPEDVPSVVLARHSVALENIEAIYGEVPRFLVSSETGYGLAPALRVLLRSVVST